MKARRPTPTRRAALMKRVQRDLERLSLSDLDAIRLFLRFVLRGYPVTKAGAR